MSTLILFLTLNQVVLSLMVEVLWYRMWTSK
jgi:hypothetical protein